MTCYSSRDSRSTFPFQRESKMSLFFKKLLLLLFPPQLQMDDGRVNMQTDSPQKRHLHGIGLYFLHVPTVVLYCVLMSGRRGKFNAIQKNRRKLDRSFCMI